MKKIRLEPGPFVLPMPAVLIGATVNKVPNFMPEADYRRIADWLATIGYDTRQLQRTPQRWTDLPK